MLRVGLGGVGEEMAKHDEVSNIKTSVQTCVKMDDSNVLVAKQRHVKSVSNNVAMESSRLIAWQIGGVYLRL